MKIIDLYVLTISEMLEKRVGRKYELISRSWLEVAKRDFKNAHDEDIRIGIVSKEYLHQAVSRNFRPLLTTCKRKRFFGLKIHPPSDLS